MSNYNIKRIRYMDSLTNEQIQAENDSIVAESTLFSSMLAIVGLPIRMATEQYYSPTIESFNPMAVSSVA